MASSAAQIRSAARAGRSADVTGKVFADFMNSRYQFAEVL
jgi:hypothetical protein